MWISFLPFFHLSFHCCVLFHIPFVPLLFRSPPFSSSLFLHTFVPLLSSPSIPPFPSFPPHMHPQSLLPTPATMESEEEIGDHFIYSIVWACGGFLSARNKAVFSQWWRTTFTSCPHQFPQEGTIWDYYTKPGTKGFFSWKKSLNPFSPPSEKTAPPFVHTIRGMATIHFISLLINRGYPVLVSGIGGSGKTALLQQFLGEFCRAGTGTNLLHVYCNLLTSAEVIWNQIVDCLEWDWGKKYTPKGCKRLVCFIDDLHNTEVCVPPVRNLLIVDNWN